MPLRKIFRKKTMQYLGISNKALEINANIEGYADKKLLKKLESYKVKTAPGGSSANTLYGVALLGGNVVFCGKVGKDKHGDIYEEKMLNGGVKPKLARSDKITGHAITFITPDSERTFAVHLGASLSLEKEDVFFDDLKQSKMLHIEGYQLEDVWKYTNAFKQALSQTVLEYNSEIRNKEAIINTILAVSRVMERNPKIREIDINPLFATSKNALAADIRIILE